MSKSTRKLDALAALLERTGGHPKRIEAVRRAQNFRRSWVDLAEILVTVRSANLYQKWGYSDFYEYAQDELTLKRGTVDKLTISYSTLERHAPGVLERDGVARKIPSYESLDYYHKTIGELEPPEVVEVVDEAEAEAAANEGPGRAPRRGRVPQLPDEDLRREFEEAVFTENQPLGELRRRFDPVFFPKPKGSDTLDRIKKANAAARKLAELVTEIDGLPDTQVRKLETELGKLRSRLDELAEPIKDRVAKATARANKKALKARAQFAEQQLAQAPKTKAGKTKAKSKSKAKTKASKAAKKAAPRKRKSG